MTETAQSRAVHSYRQRLPERGILRFELKSKESDRNLLRKLARKRNAAHVEKWMRCAASFERMWMVTSLRKVESSERLGTRHLQALTLISAVPSIPDARSICDQILAGHEYRQQSQQAETGTVVCTNGLANKRIVTSTLHRSRSQRSGAAFLRNPQVENVDLLQDWFVGPAGVKALFFDRILPFDEAAAWEWARLMAEGKCKGRLREGLDMIIAATTLRPRLRLGHRQRARFRRSGHHQPASRPLKVRGHVPPQSATPGRR